MRVLHILDHSVPLQSGYVFRTLAILREQRARGWETLHLTGPKQGTGAAIEEQVNGWHFYRTPGAGSLLDARSEEHTSELQSRENLVCRLLLEKKKQRCGR